jgi:SRR1
MLVNDSEAPFYQYTDSFTVAGPRKKRNTKARQEHPSPRVLLDNAMDELITGSWFAHCQRWFAANSHRSSCHIKDYVVELVRDYLDEITFTARRALCLGLGSPTSSRDARVQLAFLVQLCDALDLVCTPFHVRVQHIKPYPESSGYFYL